MKATEWLAPRWHDFKAALSELLKPTWEQEDRPDLEADAAVRTEWVRSHRHPPEGGDGDAPVLGVVTPSVKP